MKTFLQAISIFFIFSIRLLAQSVTITPGSTGGVELTNLTNDQILNITNPKTGMLVFDKTFQVVRVFDGTKWACVSCDEPSYMVVQKVQVKSFDYEPTNCGYSNLRDFKSSDDGLGDVKTSYSGGQPNGFLLDGKEVIVFENSLSTEIQNLPPQQLLGFIHQTNWGYDYTYIQNCDIAVKSDHTNLIYNVREAGKVDRYVGTVFGQKAYRFTNRMFIEKYGSSSNLLNKLVTNTTTFNLLSAMGITNADNYHIVSTSPYFVVNNGILSFYRPTSGKPTNNYGIIYFLPKSDSSPLMRMRVFSHRPTISIRNQYFDTNGEVINLTTYLGQYFNAIVNNTTNVPFVLHIPQGTNNLRVADDNRVPPPTAVTEETL